MSYPPAVPPKNRTNTTAQGDLHPTDHNTIAQALEDVVAELGNNPSGSAASVTARLDNWVYSRGFIAQAVAAPANPATDYYTLTDNVAKVLDWTGFSPIPYTAEGGRKVRLDGTVRMDGGALTSNSGSLEWFWQRRTAGTITATGGIYIASVESFAAQQDSTRIAPFIGYDEPPAGTHFYELSVRWRAGTGAMRIAGGTGAYLTDVGPGTGATTALEL